MMDQICERPALMDMPFVLLTSKRLEPSERASKLVNEVAKPVRRASLLAAVRASQESGRSEAALRFDEDSKSGLEKADSKEAGLRILVVEDNPVNSLMVVRVLEKQGHSAWAATSGEEALAFFNRQTFDAVLMDIQMPDIDGFEVTRRIRDVEGTERHLPVIATTAHALDGDRERCLASGMDEYLTKPIQFDELFAALERVARQSNTPPQDNAPTLSEPVQAR
jgi:CheY-like chemotaxis protein